MSINNPAITVLMPAYNAGNYIGEAIASVLAQSFTDFELLIVNDGSTDQTLEVINQFNDPRIVVVHQKNLGVSLALNNGLQHARSNYIARFDADDICYPNRLQVQYDFMQRHPEYQIVGSGADYMDVEGNYLFTQEPAGYSNSQLQQLKYSVCPLIHSCVMYKKDTVLSYGGYNEYAYTFEDHFLWLDILKDHQACNLPEALIKIRINPESITIDEKWRPRKFLTIKYTALKKRSITERDSIRLQQICREQYSHKVKHGSYYALCGKKFLLNNYQPQKARAHMAKAISIHPLRFDNYLLYTISYLPAGLLTWLHKITSAKQLIPRG
jgi:glycosyltransferase involved in cell wall biosynthesis